MLRSLPLGLLALGALVALAAAVAFVRAGAPLDARAVPALALVGLAGALFGASLLALRVHDARRFPRGAALVAMGGCLLGGFAAFALMAVGAGGGQMLLASAMALLVLLALAGVATGGAYLRALG